MNCFKKEKKGKEKFQSANRQTENKMLTVKLNITNII